MVTITEDSFGLIQFQTFFRGTNRIGLLWFTDENEIYSRPARAN